MLRRLLAVGLVSGAILTASGRTPAEAYVSVDVNLHFGSDTFGFDHAPRFVSVPSTHVYYAHGPECDIYRYGDWYYVNNGYDWYRAPSYAGPFVRTAYIAVPRTIVTLPVKYRRYNGHYVTTDPWRNRWHRSNDRHDGGSYRDGRWNRNDRDDDRWSSRDRDGQRWRDRDGRDRDRNDDRWADRGNSQGKANGKGKGQGKGKGKGKKNGHGQGRG